jgi:threonine/homoserine/homoserine lactone efflux protein
MIKKGFKFGMLLQIAIGPVCIYIFNLTIRRGWLSAFISVLAVVIIDALFISLSIIGISAVVEKRKKLLKIFGSSVLIIFGIRIIISAINSSSMTLINTNEVSYIKIFLSVMFLTVSNPLTIIFWSGVFSTKIIEEKFDKNDEIKFGIGAVLSTFIFLNFIGILGQFTKEFLPMKYIMILNVIVGVVLVYFGIRLIFHSTSDDSKALFLKNNKKKIGE